MIYFEITVAFVLTTGKIPPANAFSIHFLSYVCALDEDCPFKQIKHTHNKSLT